MQYASSTHPSSLSTSLLSCPFMNSGSDHVQPSSHLLHLTKVKPTLNPGKFLVPLVHVADKCNQTSCVVLYKRFPVSVVLVPVNLFSERRRATRLISPQRPSASRLPPLTNCAWTTPATTTMRIVAWRLRMCCMKSTTVYHRINQYYSAVALKMMRLDVIRTASVKEHGEREGVVDPKSHGSPPRITAKDNQITCFCAIGSHVKHKVKARDGSQTTVQCQYLWTKG